jgi:hypothetical protein
MASGIKVTGDYNALQADLSRMGNKFEDLSGYEFGKLNNEIANHWKKGYNDKMSVVAPSMAKARLMKKTQGKVYYSFVSIPQKAINYDLGEPRQINLATNTNARNWVKRKWIWNNITSWTATKSFSKLSYVYGGRNKPLGTIVALSRKDKGMGSIIESQSNESKQFAKSQLKEKAPKIFSRVGKSLLRKRIYKIDLNIKLGGK